MSNKSGSSRQAIPLPQGGGAVQGIGESFSPDLFTGTGNFTVPLALPPGRNGFQPQLSLDYSTGAGNGPFGLGWQLSVPGVARKTAAGVPRYRDQASDPADRDTFILSGAEDLVPVGEPEPAVTRFRPRVENAFARIEHVQNGDEDVWRVSSRDGLVSVYGGHVEGQNGPAVVADPADRTKVFAWRLSQTTDPFGNRIEYRYRRDTGSDGPHVWDQLYLEQVRYVDYEKDGDTRFLVSVRLVYEERGGDRFSEYRAGFEVRTRLRCKRIEVRTHPADEDVSVRSYELVYLDELVAAGELPEDRLPPNRVSLLSRIRVVGHDGDRREELPPLDFGYTRFAPERQRFQLLQAVGDALPPRSLSDGDFEMVDLFGKGLPDVVRIDGGAEFWRNLGAGLFDRPREMEEVPAGVRLRDAGVQLADMNGDGRADLLTLPDGYHPLAFRGRWGARVPYSQAPRVEFGERDIRLVDLDGDGVVDALRTADSFELFFNDEREGWLRVERRERRPLAEFPDLTFDDDRVKLADVTGDGLQDFVFVRQGRVDYWPYLGHGRWGRRITMDESPTFEEAIGEGAEFDPARVLFGDLDGDGLDDIAYVGDDRVVLCINQGGARWSAPTTISGTPPFTEIDGVRLADMLGTGMAGVLWTFDRLPGQESNFRFLDPTGGLKPYVLDAMDNHMGAVTRVRYAPSTTFYVADREQEQIPWETPLPFPVHVVERVEVIDEVSRGKLTTRYRYHHGYWDGVEREFRGFGRVEQVDTESFDRFHDAGPGEPAFAVVRRELFAPPILTRTWFHLGPVGDELGERLEPDFSSEYWPGDAPFFGRAPETEALLNELPASRRGDALRALRGSVLRSELYALDGTERADRPFTVTETQHAVRQEQSGIFFPHAIAERLTQWERGDDPMTRFTFTDAYDAFGRPREQTLIACPRGWRTPADAPAEGYLATRTRTEYASPSDPGVYVHDRVARATTFEISDTAGRRLADVAAGDDVDLTVIGHTVAFYDGPAFTGLPAGRVGAFGAPVRRAELVLTEEILRQAHATSEAPPYLDPDGLPAWTEDYPLEFRERLPALAGHTFHAGDEADVRGYYVQSERLAYDFQMGGGTPRGLCRAVRDPLGTAAGERDTTIGYDEFGLRPAAVTDPAGLAITAEYDRRTLEARVVVDPNGNRSMYAFTPLGLLKETSHAGDGAQPEGDRTRPSLRMSYDLLAFERSSPGDRQPISVRTERHVHHDTESDVPAPERDETIVAVEFSDGFGRLVQTRTQAEDAIFGDAVFGGSLLPQGGEEPVPETASGAVNPDAQRSNVVVSGATTYDNKGRVVAKREPFYATGLAYAPPLDNELGHEATLFYDALGRVERTLNPDGSEQRAVTGVPLELANPDRFTPTPWEAFAYDANDNARRTHGAESPGSPGHRDTPTSTVVDALGRVIESVVRNGPDSDEDWFVTRSTYDLRANLLTTTDAMGRQTFNYVYDLADNPLRIESIDAGVRTVVLDAAGGEIERRDGRGSVVLQAYDVLNRPSRTWARDDGAGRVTLRERLEYGDDGTPEQPAAERAAQRARNRLCRMYRHYDEAGRSTFEAYDFKGNVLERAWEVIADEAILRVFPAQDDPAPDWQVQPFRVDWEPPEGTSLDEHAASLVEPTRFEVSASYDSLDRPKVVRCPRDVDSERRELRPRYNRAGALEALRLDGEPIVERIAYNAKGQRVLLALGGDGAGSGILVRYAHDPRTFRLVRLRTDRYRKPAGDEPTYRLGGPALQDLAYDYDLIGNLLAIHDRSPTGGLTRTFQYDALYRLVAAVGREQATSLLSRPWEDPPKPQDLALAQRYTETYVYDRVGNLRRLRHTSGRRGNAGSFTRTLALAAGSNRLRSVMLGGGETGESAYTYDANGSLVGETTSRHFEWDHGDRMKACRTQVADAEPSVHTHYLYDSSGTRVKKLVRRQGGHVESTVYVAGMFEHHRRRENGGQLHEHDRLHVTDGEQRLALVRIGPAPSDDEGPAVQIHLGDHLGSNTLVVSRDGAFVNREEYTPYGETSSGGFARKRYRFAGRERDGESGLAYHGERYYAPWLCRWISADPAGDADGPNLYAYVGGNPLGFVDPDGLQRRPRGPEIHHEGGSIVQTQQVGNLHVSMCLESDPAPPLVVSYEAIMNKQRGAYQTPPFTVVRPETIVEEMERTGRGALVTSDDKIQELNELSRYARRQERAVAKLRKEVRDLTEQKLVLEKALNTQAYSTPEFVRELTLAERSSLSVIYLGIDRRTGELYIGRTTGDEFGRYLKRQTEHWMTKHRDFEWRILERSEPSFRRLAEENWIRRAGGPRRYPGGKLLNWRYEINNEAYETQMRSSGLTPIPRPTPNRAIQRGARTRVQRGLPRRGR